MKMSRENKKVPGSSDLLLRVVCFYGRFIPAVRSCGSVDRKQLAAVETQYPLIAIFHAVIKAAAFAVRTYAESFLFFFTHYFPFSG